MHGTTFVVPIIFLTQSFTAPHPPAGARAAIRKCFSDTESYDPRSPAVSGVRVANIHHATFFGQESLQTSCGGPGERVARGA